MADYPKTRTTGKMYDGKWWERTTNIPGLPNTTKYTRWYGDWRIALYHKRGNNEYTYRMDKYGKYITAKFHAKSLKEAQDRVDLMIENKEV
jgi:hypothetical protein